MSNVGSAAMLAADACADLGLTVHRPHGPTLRRLRSLIPAGGSVAGPVDTTATVSGESFRRCLELLAADEEVHAIVALTLPTGATGDLVAAIGDADVAVPLAAVVLDQPESVRLLPRSSGEGPGTSAYGYPSKLGRGPPWPGPRPTVPGGPSRAATSRSSPICGPTMPGP